MGSRNDTNAVDDAENTTEEKQPLRPTTAATVKIGILEQIAGDEEDERFKKKETGDPSATPRKRKIKEQSAGDEEDERFKKKETGGPLATPRKRKIKEHSAGDEEDERFKKKETRGPSATPRKRKIKEQSAGDGDDARFKMKEAGGPSTTQRELRVKDIPEKSVKESGGNLDHNSKSTFKRKIIWYPAMIAEAIESLKKRRGASLKEISQYLTDHFRVDEKKIPHILKAKLKYGVRKGIYENTSAVGAERRFKVKNTEYIRSFFKRGV